MTAVILAIAALITAIVIAYIYSKVREADKELFGD